LDSRVSPELTGVCKFRTGYGSHDMTVRSSLQWVRDERGFWSCKNLVFGWIRIGVIFYTFCLTEFGFAYFVLNFFASFGSVLGMQISKFDQWSLAQWCFSCLWRLYHCVCL